MDYSTTLSILLRQKKSENQDPAFQTQYGDMGPEAILKDEDLTPPSLSALLADESIDHTGPPISVEYRELWITKASANPNGPFGVPQADLDRIRKEIAPAAVDWELKNGTVYHHDQSPTPHGHEGLQDSKIVPIKLNLDEGKDMHSFAADKALRNNDFSAQRTKVFRKASEGFIPPGFERWRIYDSCDRLETLYPAHYIVWNDEGNSLYARIPKPLGGLSRAASCDHCRIHEPESAWDEVEYFDDRTDVGDKIRQMSVTDSAITPFSLCRFHWWYVWSGELLRPSHVYALEMLVSGPLFDRWGISHMREFLFWMEKHRSTPDELDDDNDDDDVDDDDQPREADLLPLDQTEAAVSQCAKNSSSPNVPQATVASTDEQLTVPGGQQAGNTTADGPHDTTNSDQGTRELEADVFRDLVSQEHKRMAELAELANTGLENRTDPARRAAFGLASRAYRRQGLFWKNIIEGYREVFPAPTNGQETNGLASQHTNGDSQNMGDIHNTQSVPSSAPVSGSHHSGAVGPAEPSRMNGQSTAPRTYASMTGTNETEQAAVEANSLVASNPVAPVPQTQTNGEPTWREKGLLYEPPTGPRSQRLLLSASVSASTLLLPT